MRLHLGLLVIASSLLGRSALAQPEAPPPLPPQPSVDSQTELPTQAPPPVLAEPVQPAETTPPQADKPVTPEAGYFPGEGFVLRSSDKNYKLRVGLQSALRLQMTVNGKASLSNPFMTLRPILEGNLYRPWIRFWTSLELAANPTYLLDSYVEIQPVDEFGIRVGQQWTPFSRHEAISGPHQLLLPEWNQVSNYFWTGRDKGATLYGSVAKKKFDYFIGAYMGSPLRQFTPIRGNYLFVARVSVNPLGPVGSTEYAYAEKDEPAPLRMSLAVNAFSTKRDQTQENFNPSTFLFETVPTGSTTVSNGIGADYIFQSKRFTTLVEGYFRRTEPRGPEAGYSSLGGFAQFGVLLYERVLDASLRLSAIDVNLSQRHDMAYGLEVASTWYIKAPIVAVKIRYGYATQMTTPDGLTSGGAPLILSPGPLNVLTAQINTAF